jgi:hypothetical protein
MAEPLKSLPLPEDPALAGWASALNDAGHWAWVLDATWRYVFVTDEMRLSWGDSGASTSAPIGSHYFGSAAREFRAAFGGSAAGQDFRRANFLDLGRYALATMPGGREELRGVVDPEFAELVDELQPKDLPAVWAGPPRPSTFAGLSIVLGSPVWFRIDDAQGHLVGISMLFKPAAGMSQLAAAAFAADRAHLERMRVVQFPDRHPAAILMADLESSSPLARRLSAARYFAFARRLVRAADDCTIDAGSIVGRHAGDGVVGFFLAETAGSESAAASACITAARTFRGIVADVAARSEIPTSEVSLRFGLHWGATLYMGS